MRRTALLLLTIASFGVLALADEVTFNYAIAPPGSVLADANGFIAGPSATMSVSDNRTKTTFPIVGGNFSTTAGPASSFVIIPTFVAATFAGSGANSVIITDMMGNPLVVGMTQDGAHFVTNIPDGTGTYASTFTVTFVAPSILSLFGLGPNFLPDGSVSLTSAHANLSGMGDVVAEIGGGTVTVQTPSVVPEPWGLGIVGICILASFAKFRNVKFEE